MLPRLVTPLEVLKWPFSFFLYSEWSHHNSVIPLTILLVIGKLDITVYFYITPVDLYIMPGGLS